MERCSSERRRSSSTSFHADATRSSTPGEGSRTYYRRVHCCGSTRWRGETSRSSRDCNRGREPGWGLDPLRSVVRVFATDTEDLAEAAGRISAKTECIDSPQRDASTVGVGNAQASLILTLPRVAWKRGRIAHEAPAQLLRLHRAIFFITLERPKECQQR